ncbi:MAG: transcriptional regulator with GAF, ATPase, and Fis domain, partial [Kiritimatiellia bacterium]
VGGSYTVSVDVRVIAATNRDLRREVREGRFREDLFYRLNVLSILVPSLAERRADIPLLVDHFVKKYAERNNRSKPSVPTSVMERLMAYGWPGNVRQLEHVIERAIILNRGDTFDIELPKQELHAPADQPGERPVLPPPGVSLQDALAERERELIVAALQECDGVQARAARRLELSRSNLNYRIGKLGIQVKAITYR